MNQYLTPVGLTILTGILFRVAELWLAKKKITVDDKSTLIDSLLKDRTTLIDERAKFAEEREKLITELDNFGDRFRKMECELQQANLKIIDLEKGKATLEIKVQQLEAHYEKTEDN